MTAPIEYIPEAIWLPVSLIALVCAFRFAWAPSLVAGFRQNLFALRRELFLFAHDNDIQFHHPAYVRLRQTMNAMLREAEEISIVQLLLTAWLLGKPPVPAFDELLVDLDEQERATMTHFHERMCSAFGWHVIVSSPLAWAVFCGAMAWWLISSREVGEALSNDAEQLADTISISGDDCDMAAA